MQRDRGRHLANDFLWSQVHPQDLPLLPLHHDWMKKRPVRAVWCAKVRKFGLPPLPALVTNVLFEPRRKQRALQRNTILQ